MSGADDSNAILVETAGRLFEQLGPKATCAADWAQVEEAGLSSLMLPESRDGFGGGWREALLVFRLAGYHAVSLPVVEAILAARHGPDGASGFGSVAVAAEGVVGERFTGALHAVPWGREAAFVVTELGGRRIVLDRADAGQVRQGQNTAGEPRDTLHFDGAPFRTVSDNALSLHDEAALARIAQIAGALDAALGQSVTHVNDRSQFARPLAKFQSVQQVLATFANEAAAANCAAMGAFEAADRGDAGFEVPAAKLRANMAAGSGAAIAHQVHGAIGFTQEYGLHPLTRRLWSWRSEYGGDRYWADRLGARVAARGDRFWADMVARTDPA